MRKACFFSFKAGACRLCFAYLLSFNALPWLARVNPIFLVLSPGGFANGVLSLPFLPVLFLLLFVGENGFVISLLLLILGKLGDVAGSLEIKGAGE